MNYRDMLQPLHHTVIGLKKQNFDFLIFQIGFNKCGTTSLYNFMVLNNISSIHNTPCKYDMHKIFERTDYFYLNKLMIDNLRNDEIDLVLPSECTDYYQFYSDFGNEISGEYYILKRTVLERMDLMDNHIYNVYIKSWYPILSEQFKNSKFILNIRNINTWLKSKYLHRPPYFTKIRFNERKEAINDFITDNNITKELNRDLMTDIDILRIWRNEWYLYICNLIKYFDANRIRDNLLIFNVEIDPIEKLIKFFAKHGIKLNDKYWKQKNKSSIKPKWTSKQDEEQRNKWIEIEREYPEFNTNYDNVIETEYDRIDAFCKTI